MRYARGVGYALWRMRRPAAAAILGLLQVVAHGRPDGVTPVQVNLQTMGKDPLLPLVTPAMVQNVI